MANFYDDNADIRFYVERGIDWEPIVRLTEHEFQSEDGFENTAEAVDFYREVLTMLGEYVGEEIAPNWAELDKMKPVVKDGEVVYPKAWDEMFDAIKELEVHGLCVPRELGGMNAPLMVLQFMNEMFARADVSVCAHHGFHGGMALAALSYSILEGSTEFSKDPHPHISKTRFQQCIDEIVAGEEWGSMDITEPDAGSDMAQLRAKGEVDADGNWFVTGQKIFITSGHGKWHFVIARTEEPTGDDAFSGLKGLSMFLVPAFDKRDKDGKPVRTHTTIDGVETKLGHNGSATVAISFERAPAYLIGNRGEGFKYMLLLMNGARVGVGFESLGLCEAAYRKAVSYAAERRSMGKTIDQHEMIADYLDQMRVDLAGIRAINVKACWHEEIAQKTEMRLRFDTDLSEEDRKRLQKQHKRHKSKARHLTPLLKYQASEKAVEMARLAIQIHGGNGYMTEYGVEKLLRDAVVMPIYEGTSQIQALMAMKDNLLGVVKNPRRFLAQGAQIRWRMVGGSELDRRVAKLEHIQHSTIRFLLTRLTANKLGELPQHSPGEWGKVMTGWDPKKDFALAMLHAERLIQILIDVAIARELHEQASHFPERRELLLAWLERAEPRCRYLQDVITTTGLRLLGDLADSEPSSAAAAAK